MTLLQIFKVSMVSFERVVYQLLIGSISYFSLVGLNFELPRDKFSGNNPGYLFLCQGRDI